MYIPNSWIPVIAVILGVARTTWDVLIPDDRIQENTEKFRIALEEPVNAILGKNSKASVRIIDAENGK